MVGGLVAVVLVFVLVPLPLPLHLGLRSGRAGGCVGLETTRAASTLTLTLTLTSSSSAAGLVTPTTASTSGWLVFPKGDEPQAFDNVVVTTSAWRAAELVREESPQLGRALGEIEYASSAIVCSVHQFV